MMEGFGAGSVLVTNGSWRFIDIWIQIRMRIRIRMRLRNTEKSLTFLLFFCRVEMSEPFVGAKRKTSACHCDLNAEASASSTVAPAACSGKDGQTGNCGDEIAEGDELECAECRAQFLSLKDLKRHKARQQRCPRNFTLLAVNIS
jgi:hypothetical protein